MVIRAIVAIKLIMAITGTGCILMILGKYDVTTLARTHPVGFDWCHLLPLPGPF